ncbi:hypothetical protein ACIU1J_19690 [Azospirillum doebereinerae]|uniref:hypothetical protein n=1 Tax=Azospirillum doebereinerae TaxID=92933 RepID=UPI001EE5A868|nr:hypothetical protein [Azospirillum doebereinerae]MCG5241855.1 hypothetical protein [Azospirillum doebereinerae]
MIHAPQQSGVSTPSASDLVEAVMERWPQTIAVFVKHRMACPGCLMAGFQTVAEVAEIYGVDTSKLLDAFAQAIAGGPSPASPRHGPTP